MVSQKILRLIAITAANSICTVRVAFADEQGLLRGRNLSDYSDPKSVQIKGNLDNLQCTPSMLEAISMQLPYNRCPMENSPCVSHCIETSCPEATWLERYYAEVVHTFPVTPFVGLSIGCNKGFDAVNTLRMGSNNPRFNKEDWKVAMFGNSADSAGACSQGESPSVELNPAQMQRPASMHCVEPVPATVERLVSSTASLGYNTNKDQKLIISPFAISKDDEPSGLAFPTNAKAGKENLSLGKCNKESNWEEFGCQTVPVYSMDTYGSQFMAEDLKNPEQNINILSIDAEGYDFSILQGGQKMLARSEYVEFEFHRYGTWRDHLLKDAVDMLDSLGFNCYWAGKGNLWRLNGENCFFEHYETKCWSNVACANRNLAPELADIMEDTFLKTLRNKSFELRTYRFEKPNKV